MLGAISAPQIIALDCAVAALISGKSYVKEHYFDSVT